jgi:hypothetical protein
MQIRVKFHKNMYCPQYKSWMFWRYIKYDTLFGSKANTRFYSLDAAIKWIENDFIADGAILWERDVCNK